MKKINPVIYFLFLSFIVTVISCKKDPEINPNSNSSTSSGVAGHTVTGVVRDQNGNSLSGITIQCNGQTATSGNFGEFTFKNVTVADQRVVVYTNPQNYFPATATEMPSSTKITQVTLTLMPKTVTQVLTSSSGGTVTHSSGAIVDIPANGITKNGTAYSGNVNVAVAYLDPSSSQFGMLTQGPDMKAENKDGNDGTLTSYGIIRVELFDDQGNELNLASGKTATVNVPIPSSLQSAAPATIPLWYFDETKGIWVEEGSATKSGSIYTGTVSHFTDWNCDYYSSSQAIIEGRIIDCNNDPVCGVWVNIGQSYAYTDINGVFSRRIPSGVAVDVQVISTWNSGIASNVVSVPSLTATQEYDMGDIQLSVCPVYVTGRVVDCNNNPIEAWVKVKTSNGYYQSYFTADGSFKGRSATSQTAQISVMANNGGFVTNSMTTSADQNVVNDFGDIVVCGDVTIGENSFVIDGDGFSNEKVIAIINSPLPNYNIQNDDYAYSLVGGDSILPQVNGPCSLSDPTYNSVNFHLYYSNTSPATGTYALGTDFTMSIIIINENQSLNKNYYSQSGTVVVTKLDDHLVEGTFSGTFINGASQTVTISNGKFSTLSISNNYLYKVAAKN